MRLFARLAEVLGRAVPAHSQRITHHYTIRYPAHPPRATDPHYKDFEEYRRRTRPTATCALAYTGECEGGLELHHSHVEFALQNGVALEWLERDYPGVSNPAEVGAWVESGANLMWLCEFHHRGHGGVHVASASDYEAEHYIRNLIAK